MNQPDFEYEIPTEEWSRHLTQELRDHFNRVGYEGVNWDVVNHRYGKPEKHYAALHWLGERRKSRQRVTNTILAVAILTLALTAASYFGLSPTTGRTESGANSMVAEQDDPNASDLEGWAIVETEDFIACLATQAHWSGMEVIFTRQRGTAGEKWLADGSAVENQEVAGNIVSGRATYTEYEKDGEHTVDNKPYVFRLDFVKGVLDVWTFEHYGEKAGEGKAFHFNGNCEPYDPPIQ